MKNKEWKGILALLVVTALSFAVIAGSRALLNSMTDDAENGQAKVLKEYDVSGEEAISYAAKTEAGYLVTTHQKGYGGEIVMNISFDNTAETITKAEVFQQSETEGLGSRISESEFLNQLEGVKAPVALSGMADASLPETSEIDAVSGATVSSGAAVTAVNNAYYFLQAADQAENSI